MSRYTPLHRQARHLLVDGVACLSPVRTASRRTGLPADMIAASLLLSTGCFLAINPVHFAPVVCDTVVMLPAVASLRKVGNANAAARIDYCLFLGTAFTVESLVGKALISKILPIWWLFKFLVAVTALADKTAPVPLTLELRGEPIGVLPDREPSPSPVQAMVTALSPVSGDPYNTADMLCDNIGPYRVVSPSGPLDSHGLGRNGEPITTHKVLDCFVPLCICLNRLIDTSDMPGEKPSKSVEREDKKGKSKHERDPRPADDKVAKKDEKRIGPEPKRTSRLHDDSLCRAALSSHAGWMAHPLLTLSTSTGLSILHSALISAFFLLFLLLVAPRQWVKYMTLPIFPLVPVHNTLAAVAADGKSKSRAKGDGAQWLFFWTAWVILGWIGEMMRIFKPGYTSVWEITRVALAIGLGGPWLGRAALT